MSTFEEQREIDQFMNRLYTTLNGLKEKMMTPLLISLRPRHYNMLSMNGGLDRTIAHNGVVKFQGVPVVWNDDQTKSRVAHVPVHLHCWLDIE